MDDNENKKGTEELAGESPANEARPDENQTSEALPDATVDAVAGGQIQIPKFVIPDYV